MLILLACVLEPKDSDTEPATCDDLVADYMTEADAVRSCSYWSECGQVLTGTSCGCTRNWVARTDADTTAFYAAQTAAADAECDLGGSTCDCPEAYGYDCVDSVCTWDYVEDSTVYPDCQAERGGAYDIDQVMVDGDTLVVSVSYGGGCEDHFFTLCWPDGAFMESNPVQAALEIFHDDGGDMCDMAIMEDQSFDLAPLKAAWQEQYGGGSGGILIDVGGFQVEYFF